MMIQYRVAEECNTKSRFDDLAFSNVKHSCPNPPSIMSRAYHFMCISLSIITSSSTPPRDFPTTPALK